MNDNLIIDLRKVYKSLLKYKIIFYKTFIFCSVLSLIIFYLNFAKKNIEILIHNVNNDEYIKLDRYINVINSKYPFENSLSTKTILRLTVENRIMYKVNLNLFLNQYYKEKKIKHFFLIKDVKILDIIKSENFKTKNYLGKKINNKEYLSEKIFLYVDFEYPISLNAEKFIINYLVFILSQTLIEIYKTVIDEINRTAVFLTTDQNKDIITTSYQGFLKGSLTDKKYFENQILKIEDNGVFKSNLFLLSIKPLSANIYLTIFKYLILNFLSSIFLFFFLIYIKINILYKKNIL
jgi:hypothetical protein